MGGRFGRKKKAEYDPNYPSYNDPYYQGYPSGGYPPGGYPSGGYPPGGYPPGGYSRPPGGYGRQPPYPYGAGNDPYGGDYPYDDYGYGYEPTESFEPYGNRYGRGLNQMSGSPWNYGNFYMGNTTMQMMPYMQRKVAKYSARQAMGGFGGSMGGFGGSMGGLGGFGGSMGGLGGFGGSMGGFGGFGGSMPMMPMMPIMPMMPCLPASFSTPMAAPMMAAATPLPIAFNPLVQGMYPMASMNSFNWMTPSSFMSALSTGPMPYRPPLSLEFPSNISMVMPLPYGAPNPLLASSSFGGFSPQYNFSGGLSCSCCYCTPSIAPPAISYYPRPVSVPQPCPVPYPAPVPIVNVQQVPVPRPVSVVAPPIIAGGNQCFSTPAGMPLLSSQGGLMQGGFGQALVMASDQNSTIQSLLNDETSEKPKRQTSISKSIDQSRRKQAQKLASSLSNLGLNNNFPTKISSTKSKYRNKPKSNSKYTSDLDLTLETLSSLKQHRKSTHHHRNSDHNRVVCKQKQLNKFS